MARLRAIRAKKSVSDAAESLQNVIDSAEDMLEDVEDQKGDAVESLRERLSASITDARQRLASLNVSESVSEAYDNTIGFVRDDPWRAIAIGAIAVLALTALIRATSDD